MVIAIAGSVVPACLMLNNFLKKFEQMHNAGLSGIAFSLVHYVDELPLIASEVIPRLEKLGLRVS